MMIHYTHWDCVTAFVHSVEESDLQNIKEVGNQLIVNVCALLKGHGRTW